MTGNFRHISSMTVRVHTRPVIDWDDDGEPFRTGYSEPVVRIESTRGRVWELTMDGDRITSLTTYNADGITQDSLAEVPLVTLRSVAKAHLAQFDAAHDRGMPVWAAADDAAADAGQARKAVPTLREFAEIWNQTPPRVHDDETGETLTRRQALARRWDGEVTVHAIDKWTRQARTRGLIPEPAGKRRGRKPNPIKKEK